MNKGLICIAASLGIISANFALAGGVCSSCSKDEEPSSSLRSSGSIIPMQRRHPLPRAPGHASSTASDEEEFKQVPPNEERHQQPRSALDRFRRTHQIRLNEDSSRHHFRPSQPLPSDTFQSAFDSDEEEGKEAPSIHARTTAPTILIPKPKVAESTLETKENK